VTATVTDRPVELATKLVDLPWDAFTELVELEVKGKAPSGTRDALGATAASAARWYDCLVEIHAKVVDAQSARNADREEYRLECLAAGPDGRDDWWEYETEYRGLKSRTVHFQKLVQRDMTDAKATRSQRRREANEVEQAAKQELLSRAVRAHRSAGGGAEADSVLWEAYDRIFQTTAAPAE
jgi:hypothetical protein